MIEREEKAEEDGKRKDSEKGKDGKKRTKNDESEEEPIDGSSHVNNLTVPDSGGHQRLHTLRVSQKGRLVQRRLAVRVRRVDT